MPLLGRDDVLAFLEAEDEIPGAIRWAQHHGLEHTWDEGALALRVRLEGGGHGEGVTEAYLLAGTFEDYRAMPPAWRFLDPRDGRDISLPAYPAAGPFPSGSVLHPNGVICAPWNRLAYRDVGGPHDNWTEPSKWQSIEPERTQARTVPEMLARIRAEVAISLGRLAPLPALAQEERAP